MEKVSKSANDYLHRVFVMWGCESSA